MPAPFNVNTVENLSGLFQQTYGDLNDLIPDNVQIARDIKFNVRDKSPGDEFNEAVVTQLEQGVTYAGGTSSGSASAGAFTIEAPISGKIERARILSTQMLIASRIDYETAYRAQEAKPGSFRRALDAVVEMMTSSLWHRLEVDTIYGQIPLGTVGSITGDVITIATAEWAPGIWVNSVGGLISAWTNDSDTQANGTTARGAEIHGVDLDARTVTLHSGGGAGVAVGDQLYFAAEATNGTGQRKAAANSWNSFVGLHKMLSATSGTILNVDTASPLWRSTQVSCGSAPLTFQKLQRGIAMGVAKGFPTDFTCYCSPKTFADLVNDEAAARRYVNKAGGNFEVGAEGIKFYSQAGLITIRATPYVKEGFAYAISPKLWRRIGASDITFRLPDQPNEANARFFLHLQDKAGYELRGYSNQALYTKALGKSILFKDIVNST